MGLRSTVNSQVGFGGSSDRICILDGLRALKTRKVATKRSLVTVSHLISYSNRDLWLLLQFSESSVTERMVMGPFGCFPGRNFVSSLLCTQKPKNSDVVKWIDNVNLSRICIKLLYVLAKCVNDRIPVSQHYFINMCNLIDNHSTWQISDISWCQ